jgi:lipopolysaccharide heptosyltransferase II
MTRHLERHADWSAARNVLAVRLDAIGDVLMTTPALRALKRARRGRRITLLTSAAGADIARMIPEVDDVIVYQAPWMKASGRHMRADTDRTAIERLRAGGYDGAVIFTVYSQNAWAAAMLCQLAGIPRRLAHSRENPYQLLTDWVPEPEPQSLLRHEVRRQLELVAHIGAESNDACLSLALPAAAHVQAQAFLARSRIDTRAPWTVIHPGASAPSRRYPAEAYAEVARRLVRRYGWQIVFTGSAGEAALVEHIRTLMGAPSHSAAGRLDLPALCALIDAAPVLIANNTGPAHIAAALGTPVVDLYALTNLQHMPWMVESRVLYHDVPCKHCYKSICPQGHHDCLRRVPPDAVVAAAMELVTVRPQRLKPKEHRDVHTGDQRGLS